ncbi:glycoside hydrolase family 93 protein [Lasiosphaeria hispida]|uniref:Glycoside hydrolase family 93 protein n=1 Tax=Lasiosphaeria hispida TaxID=260671 RepID=A0AAJ0HCT9_9PEZI|nr:glycoside hydrolase family 93 protein [Lasiosphaeria hispida]
MLPLLLISLLPTTMSQIIQPLSPPSLIHPSGVYIRATPLSPSSILAAYAAPLDTHQALLTSLSTDNGTTWSPLGEVWRAAAATHDIDNASPLQLPSGRILFAFRNHDRAPGGAGYSWYRITVCFSDDGGRRWGFLGHVVEHRAQGLNGVWEPFLRLGRRGEVQVYYSSETGSRGQENLMVFSEDGGGRWSAPIVVSRREGARDGMVGVAEDGRGGLICVFETTEDGVFSVNRAVSPDDGYTWGERARVYTAAGGKNAGAPQVYKVGGTLVTSFMTNEGVGTPQLDGGQMKVVTSVNGGQTWSSGGAGSAVAATVAADVGAHWPGLYAIDQSHFLALYSMDGIGAVSQLYRAG